MPLAPEYVMMFEQLEESSSAASRISEMTPAEVREMYRTMRPVNPDLPIYSIRHETIFGPLGDIPLRIYTPEGSGPFGVLVYFHGGGWVIGDLDTCDSVCREISTIGNLVVVSVGYRLAPEHLYPAAGEDCYAAIEWAAANGDILKSNGKLGVAGESAGGNLSAVVSQKARDNSGPTIDFQCLLYPVVDHDMTRPSYEENGEGYLLETESMLWFWDKYCPDKAKRDEPGASPLRAKNLASLPPALIVTAEFDPLRDEGEAYANAITDAGGEARTVRYDGLVHDFFATAALFECSRGPFIETVKEIQKRIG